MIDGTDVLAVYESARRAVDRARAGEGPTLIGVDVMRMKGHAEHDDQPLRATRRCSTSGATRDPLARYRGWLLSEGVASGTELDEIDGMTHGYAEEEAQLAEPSPMPDPADAGRGVWAGDELFVPRLEIVKSPFAEA